MSFSREIEEELSGFLRRHAGREHYRKIAVFDADGTLWRGDLGEAFLRHQIERRIIPAAPKNSDPWTVYWDEVVNGNPAAAYAWPAQWNAGVAEEDLSRWCREFFRSSYAHLVFEPVRRLTHSLMNADFEVWVVSASMKWAIQAAVQGFGIQPDRVIAASVVVKNGVLTDELEIPVPFRAAKAKLVDRFIGARPLLVAGNTYWDKEMMITANEIVLGICSERKGEPNYDSETRLQRFLKQQSEEEAPTGGKRKWLSQRFA